MQNLNKHAQCKDATRTLIRHLGIVNKKTPQKTEIYGKQFKNLQEPSYNITKNYKG